MPDWLTGDVISAIATLLAAVAAAVGAPAWVAKLIREAATVAVLYAERKGKGRPGDEKRRIAEDAAKAMLPVAVRALPGTRKRLDAAIEAAVEAIKRGNAGAGRD